MRHVQQEQYLDIPEGVTVQIKARNITVTGPRGVLNNSVRHIDITFVKVNDKQIKLLMINGNRKQVASIRTVKSIVNNMIIGVTKGFKYKMRAVHAFFPPNLDVRKDGSLQIKNFLGCKKSVVIDALPGVTIELSKAQQGELIITGNDLQNVSQTAASIQQSCVPRNKDIRKFLDGIYVSEKGTVVEDM
ncbi:ribosomal 60S subunit protein L9B [Starmerella bacillaris]|uniref:Ribosomal 60S subunit protein L9B n=1 Tax=Starmerella bacillaris TaxID=1247836 RepID=A0AAV5RJB0_STABA|nr:ribosomal 60S subunit protein L9B [Starmerella bacillaris]